MTGRTVRLWAAVVTFAWAWFSPAARAQGIPFQLRAQQGNTTTLVANGGTLTFPATAVGNNISTTITATFQGTTTATIAQPQLFGSNAFAVGGSAAFPDTLNPGDSVSVTVTYTAADATNVVAQLAIPFTQAGATADAAATAGTITFNLSGTSPNLIVTYVLPTDGNVVTISNGGTITFPATVVGNNLLATVAIVNTGSGAGMVQSITPSGDPTFALQSTPLLPATLPSNSNIQFGVRYTPSQAGNNTGSLQIAFADRTVTVGLAGTGIPSLLSYQLQQGNQMTPINPNQTLNFPDTNVGNRNSLTILVKNVSVTAISITAGVTATGAGFAVTDQPIAPINLNPNDTFVFTVTFAPTVAGAATGRLRIGNDTFTLAGNAIGGQLTFTYGAGNTSVLPGGTILFSPFPIGQPEQVVLTIQNTGTTNATVTTIGITNPQAPFTVNNQQLPLTLAPNQSAQVTLTFTPTATGAQTATLQVDANQFTLSGFGSTLPPLPDFQFTGASGNQPGVTQVNIGLSLASGFPAPLNGTLTLTTNTGNLPPDPTVQFSTGGRTVAFTIAANSTQAVFAGAGPQIALQTGSLAETITITPDFTVANGGPDVTPASPAVLTLTVPSGPVQLQNAVVTQNSTQNTTTNSTSTLVLQITGYSPTRNLSSMQFQFATSAKLSSNTVSLNLQPNAVAWFESTASQSFGGQFLVSVPFTITSGGVLTNSTPSAFLQSVTITATDSQGSSNPINLSLTP